MAAEQDPTRNGDNALGRRRMLILYGSETGNSEEAASDIERMARRLHFKTLLEEMNDAELSDLLQYSFVIFIISTTGQGDLPKNARKFWKSLLRRRLPPNCLRQVKFTTLGLGDSSYLQYNWAARKLHKRLEQLGAIEFLPRGEADERHEEGIDGTLLPWCLTLRTYLEKEYPLPPGLLPIPSDVPLTPKFFIELANQGLDLNARDIKDEPTLGYDTTAAESACKIKNTSQAASIVSPVIIVPGEGTFDLPHTIDGQDRQSDLATAVSKDLRNSPQISGRIRNEHATDLSPDTAASNQLAEVYRLGKRNTVRHFPAKSLPGDFPRSTGEAPRSSLLPIPGSWLGFVDENVRLTPSSHWQDVRQFTLRIPAKGSTNGELQLLGYKPGDVAIIYPKNFAQDVQALINLMGWGKIADQPFKHVCQSPDLPWSTPKNCYPLPNSTLRDLLTDNYDITCIPRRTFFAEIAQYTDDPTHKERLMEFADPSHSDEFWDYTSRPRRSILEVLQDFPSVRVPYQNVPSVFPIIRGREYSIASSELTMSDQHRGDTIVNLVVALVKYKTVLRKTRQGLCSRYIASLEPNTPVNITIRSNKVPESVLDVNIPLLAIAAGTGIAPIRSLIHERKAVKLADGSDAAKAVLFYGGRNRQADFFYEDEWKSMGVEVITAFSRDQPFKVYVQDRLLENYSVVCSLLRKRCGIVLCGSSGKMPEAVRLALYECMVKGGLAPDREQAKTTLHKDFTFWEEVW